MAKTSKKAAAKSGKKTSPGKKAVSAKSIPATKKLPPKTNRVVLYVDSSFFFPEDSGHGYTDDFQGGRYTLTPNQLLQAPILLPVGAKIFTITMYYKNTSTEPMMVTYLKKHINHHAFSGEVEVSFENLPPGSLPPDNYLEKVINHFENLGVIKDKYLYFLQVQGTGKIDATKIKTVRGMRIEYTL